MPTHGATDGEYLGVHGEPYFAVAKLDDNDLTSYLEYGVLRFNGAAFEEFNTSGAAVCEHLGLEECITSTW